MIIKGKELIVTYIKVRCIYCGSTWGITLKIEDDFESIYSRQTICRNCINLRLGELDHENRDRENYRGENTI